MKSTDEGLANGRRDESGTDKSAVTVSDALDSVLGRAVVSGDDAVIEAYQEIFNQKSSQRTYREQTHSALRLGLLLGLEVRRRRATGPSNTSTDSAKPVFNKKED